MSDTAFISGDPTVISWSLEQKHLNTCNMSGCMLTHCGLSGDACIHASVNWVIICSCRGLLPVRCQAIIWTISGVLSVGPLWTNSNEIHIQIWNIFNEIYVKISSVKWQLFCQALNVRSSSDRKQWMSDMVQISNPDITHLRTRCEFQFTYNHTTEHTTTCYSSVIAWLMLQNICIGEITTTWRHNKTIMWTTSI